MIVVDSNIIAYLCLGGDESHLAEKVLLKDSDWDAPLLWRSEFRNIVAGYMRRGTLTLEKAEAIVAETEILLHGREHTVSSSDVLHRVSASRCSAYDCEFVTLAQILEIPLVTNDRAILGSFSTVACSMQDFLA